MSSLGAPPLSRKPQSYNLEEDEGIGQGVLYHYY